MFYPVAETSFHTAIYESLYELFGNLANQSVPENWSMNLSKNL